MKIFSPLASHFQVLWCCAARAAHTQATICRLRLPSIPANTENCGWLVAVATCPPEAGHTRPLSAGVQVWTASVHTCVCMYLFFCRCYKSVVWCYNKHSFPFLTMLYIPSLAVTLVD